MDDKILWDIIDGLRDELNIAQDGITDLNEVVKDLQAENERLNDKEGRYKERLRERHNEMLELRRTYPITLRKEIKELKADEMKYIAEYNSLKAELEKVRKGNIDGIVDIGLDNERLRRENEELKAENKRIRNTLVDNAKMFDKLKAENKQQDKIPMEYKAEAEAYISHNPKVNKVYFFMVADDCISDDGYAQDWACNVDDAIAIINNE